MGASPAGRDTIKIVIFNVYRELAQPVPQWFQMTVHSFRLPIGAPTALKILQVLLNLSDLKCIGKMTIYYLKVEILYIVELLLEIF